MPFTALKQRQKKVDATALAIPLADSVESVVFLQESVVFLQESVVFFSGISHFLVHYVHKIRGIGNWIPESATGPLLNARRIGHFKIVTFSRLSDMIS